MSWPRILNTARNHSNMNQPKCWRTTGYHTCWSPVIREITTQSSEVESYTRWCNGHQIYIYIYYAQGTIPEVYLSSRWHISVTHRHNISMCQQLIQNKHWAQMGWFSIFHCSTWTAGQPCQPLWNSSSMSAQSISGGGHASGRVRLHSNLWA